jgi:hypothetical protein
MRRDAAQRAGGVGALQEASGSEEKSGIEESGEKVTR